MDAFYAVAKGSDKEPRFIVLKYLPEGKDVAPIALVGKSMTYDSGGYAVKPASSALTMKCDMSGGGSVVGTVYALAKNKVKKNVVAVMAACENMISGKAYVNGDIISSMKKTTIEVLNTDAEGRLTLADAIYYAVTKLKPSAVIDIATLTGACVVALGDHTTGMVTNNDELCEKLEKTSKFTGEYMHKFPVVKEMRELLKGKQGDLVNSTGRYGGAITAGLFLENFVENTPWVHLDIAGPAYVEHPYSVYTYGASGVPVRTLYYFIKSQSECDKCC